MQQIETTTDYGLFEMHENNRDLRPNKVELLVKSMRQHGYIAAYPVHAVMNGGGETQNQGWPPSICRG